MAKILIADDNSNVQKTVALALADLGVEVVSVNNGEAAVRKLATFSPDLILADIFMPVRSGYEVCEFVKKDSRFSHVPVVLLVGAFDPLDEREAQRVGADGILKKPFVPPEPLITMVKTLLDRTMNERLVAVPAAKPAPAQAAISTAPLTSHANDIAQEALEESLSPEFPSPAKRVSFGEGNHPVAFGTLLEVPLEQVPAQESAPVRPSEIDPLDDEQVLTSPRDANLGDPVFWQNDAREPEVAPESSVEAETHASSPVETSWNHQAEPPSSEELLAEPIEPFELIHEGVQDSSLRVADPDSILLDQAAQAALTVESQQAEDLVATPMDWLNAANTEVDKGKKAAPEVVETVTNPNDAIEPEPSFEPAPDLPPVSLSPEKPLATELSSVVHPVEIEQPAAAVSASAAPIVPSEPEVTVAPKTEAAAVPETQGPEDTARSIPVKKWAELTASVPSEADEPAAPKFESAPTEHSTPVEKWSELTAQVPIETSEPDVPKMEASPVAQIPVARIPVAVTDTAPTTPVISAAPAPSAPAPAPAPDPALVEAVVQRVLDKMRPQVVDIITKEFLRPIVQALVHREIEKH